MNIIMIGNKKCKRINYKCIECNKEDLHYITAIDDIETHYTRCYKCILNDHELKEYFKLKTEWATGRRS